MKSKQIIWAERDYKLDVPELEPYLHVSEFYMDTIQGEGIYTGVPASFLRLQGCVLNCTWCDTHEVWRKGNCFTLDELLDLMFQHDVISRLKEEQHLVITGGSPLLQQNGLILFLEKFQYQYGFLPFVEIENECVLFPKPDLLPLVSCWNNSPKLSNCGIQNSKRYQPKLIRLMASLQNSWFKFVITQPEDWKEIEDNFLTPELIKKGQVILMPEGSTKEEVEQNREMVIDLAIEQNVRYCTREHIVIWGKKTGV